MIILETPSQRNPVLHLSRKVYVGMYLIILQAVQLNVNTDHIVEMWLEFHMAQDQIFPTVRNFSAPFPITSKENLVFSNFVCF